MGKRVFLSWSGARSRVLATRLREWTPSILPDTELFFSPNIGGGYIWLSKLLKELTAAEFGIVCVTRENQASPWLHFEVGALWQRAGSDIPVCPLLLDLPLKSLKQPLSLFQARRFDEKGMYELFRQLAEGTKTTTDQLRRNFKAVWPSLRKDVAADLKSIPPARASRIRRAAAADDLTPARASRRRRR